MKQILKLSPLIGILNLLFLISSMIYSIYFAMDLYSHDVLEVYGKWVELQQVYFIATLFLALFSIFNLKYVKIFFSVSLFSAYFAYSEKIFDKHLHDIFISSGFYSSLGYMNFAGNSQYSKLILFGFVALIMLIQILLFKFRRTFTQFFIIFLLGINLFTVFLNHKYFPSGMLNNLASFKTDEYKKFSEMPLSEFKIVCKRSNLICRHVDGNRILFDNTDSYSVDNDMKLQLTNLRENSSLLTNDVIKDINQLGTLFVRTNLKNKDVFYEIYDIDFIKYSWQLNIAYFSMSTFVISLFWYYFIFILIVLHEKASTLRLLSITKALESSTHEHN